MNREIKFRAWDTDNGNMVFFDGPEICSEYGLLAWDSNTGICNLDITTESMEVMQYTGLKDARGKEIYEGDMVKEKMCIDLFKVVFCGGAFWVKDGKGPDLLLSGEDLEFEVMGNIWENPELLEAKK